MNARAIEALGLTRRYGKATVLDLENLQVGQGEAVALLGPNGAGKTTMVNILSTLIKPTNRTGRVARPRRRPRGRRGAQADRRHRPVLRGWTTCSQAGRT